MGEWPYSQMGRAELERAFESLHKRHGDLESALASAREERDELVEALKAATEHIRSGPVRQGKLTLIHHLDATIRKVDRNWSADE